jgi:hypothetical protein
VGTRIGTVAELFSLLSKASFWSIPRENPAKTGLALDNATVSALYII